MVPASRSPKRNDFRESRAPSTSTSQAQIKTPPKRGARSIKFRTSSIPHFSRANRGATFWANQFQTLTNDVNDLGVSSTLVLRVIEQMSLVAQSVRLTPKLQNTIAKDRAVLARDLGPNPDVDLGPDAADRDPLVVYTNGQVENFIR